MNKTLRKNIKHILAFGLILSGMTFLGACSSKPSYDHYAVNQALISQGLSLTLQKNAGKRFSTLPTIVNAPKIQFNLVTVDPNFAAQFNFEEARTGYIFDQFFTQQKLVKQFIDNTAMAMHSMRIPLTNQPERYRIDAKILKLSFKAKTLKNFEALKRGYHNYMMGHLKTAYRIEDIENHSTVWQRVYDTSSTMVMPEPGQKSLDSAKLLYNMMTDSSMKFGHDIAKACSFYRLPEISCRSV